MNDAAVAGSALRVRGRRPGRLPREATFIYGSLVPVYAVTFLVSLLPLIYAGYVSFHSWIMTQSPGVGPWVGLANYVKVFTSPESRAVITNTFLLTAASVAVGTVLGLGAALVLNASFVGRGLLRSAILLPWAIPGVAAGIMWWWLFNSRFGILNYLLLQVGIIGERHAWLVDYALWSVVAANVWKEMPLAALLFLGALQSIDVELYEAAMLDGSNKIGLFRFITLPLIRNLAVIVLIFQTASAIKTFDLIYAMTQGGPAGATTTLALWTYFTSFRYWNFGFGSAIAFTGAALILGISFVYLRVAYTREEDQP
jgi:ABC-type sugar transport system permease subunit